MEVNSNIAQTKEGNYKKSFSQDYSWIDALKLINWFQNQLTLVDLNPE